MADPNVLSNYSVNFVIDDSGCNEGKGIDSVVTLVRSGGSRISRRGAWTSYGGPWTPRQLRFENFACQNERIWTRRGARAGRASLDPPMVRDHAVDAIIGPACSSSGLGVGRLASQWNVPVVTYGGSTALLSDKSVFTTYSRTMPQTATTGTFY